MYLSYLFGGFAALALLKTVLAAIALFFAGLSTKVASQSTRKLVLALGCVLFVSTVVFLVTLPIRLTN